MPVDQDQFTRICDSADVPRGSAKGFVLGGEPVCVVRVDDGLFAFDDVCPHRGARLSAGSLNGTTLMCAAHTWEFDVRTGDLLRLRAPACLTMREVREEGGAIYVAIGSSPEAIEQAA